MRTTRPTSKIKRLQAVKRNLVAYSLVFPGLLLFYVFVVYPMSQTLVYSLFDYRGLVPVFQTPFIGINNFVKAFTDSDFWNAVRNTFYLAFFQTAAKMAVALILAYFLYRKLRGWKAFQAALYLPAIVPVVVSAVLWRLMYEGNFGLVNTVLKTFQLEAWARFWLSDPSTAMNAVIVSSVWFSVPFAMLVLFSYMLRIPNELLEAAKIDGASSFRMLTSIILPLILPSVMFLVILSIADNFKGFEYVMLFTNGGPMGKTEVIGLYSYRQAFQIGNYGYASTLAIIVLSFLILISVTVLAKVRKYRFEI